MPKARMAPNNFLERVMRDELVQSQLIEAAAAWLDDPSFSYYTILNKFKWIAKAVALESK